MGAVKPVHVLAFVCCLVPLAVLVAGAVWFALRRD